MHFRALIRKKLKILPETIQQLLDKRTFFFPDLQSSTISHNRKKCLIAYTPWAVAHLVKYTQVGKYLWDTKIIHDTMHENASRFSNHTNHWESVELVRQLTERGFLVDYVSEDHAHLVTHPEKYDVIIDSGNNLQTWATINPRAKKLFYCTTAHWLYNNQAELQRHQWLKDRRQIEAPTVRQLPPNLGATVSDLTSTFGNEFTQAQFTPYTDKVRRISLSAVDDDVPKRPKNFDTARNHFLYFGSNGWVHRGLDLCIEAFLEMPKLHLHIAGPLPDTPGNAFQRAYGTDLQRADNIHIHGVLDPLGTEFRTLCDQCCALVYPSASEGCSGSMVQCMHHGLIPIVTPCGGLLNADSEQNMVRPVLAMGYDKQIISEIMKHCNILADSSNVELQRQQTCAYEYARTNHTRTAFSLSLSAVLDDLLQSSVESPHPSQYNT